MFRLQNIKGEREREVYLEKAVSESGYVFFSDSALNKV